MSSAVGSGPVHCRPWHDVDPLTLHDLVRLRVDVFVVEQACAYPELDGRDVEPDALHLWTADAAGPTAYLRLLAEPAGGRRIGRVATRVDVRGQGLSRRLLEAALSRCGDAPVVLDAQTHLTRLYAGLGFAASGSAFVEDGIPHVPMRRPGAAGPAGPGGSLGAMSTDHDTGPDPQLDADPAEQPASEVRDEDLTPYRSLGEHDREGEEVTPSDPRADDPDLRSAGDALEEPDDPGFLATDELGPAVDDEDGWEPPDHEVVLEQGMTLDEKLAAEVPEPDPRLAGSTDADRDLWQS